MRIGLSFSGGAARGAYQMGVWRALRELELDRAVTGVTGTSIGAINASLFVQGNWEAAVDLWEQVRPHHLFPSVPERLSSAYFRPLLKDLLLRGKVNIDGLKTLLYAHLDEDRLRASGVQLGIAVYNKTLRQGGDLFLDDIPPGLVCDYIYSSAMLPIFPPQRIGEHEYVDGGFHSILPIGPLADRCRPDWMVAVDVSKFGKYSNQLRLWTQEHADKLLYIRPSRLISPLDVTPASLKNQMALGYEEGMQALEHSALMLAYK